MDSAGKKVEFLASVARELATPVRTVHGRAEELGRRGEFRERYDVVVARAVARLPCLAELCLPLLKRSGWFIAMKGPAGREELAESGRPCACWGAKLTRYGKSDSAFRRRPAHVDRDSKGRPHSSLLSAPAGHPR